ncbi:anti-sigma factor family protein [Streptomyces sp. NPDC096310]|uniref:anti-sigma factor family protein n=1 Tax=Streptomyces sp. NPDC096310 TaxID=3366082 RepID=UPI0037FE7535
MSGTGPTPAEQHLGDRLAALVDGELNHDARERVLAHLATCARCKAEADAQRRLKTAFAQAAPPQLSAGLLARLQGLPGGPGSGSGGDDDGKGRLDGGRFGEGAFGDGSFGVRTDGFGYVPAGQHTGVLPGGSGFRIHDVGRHGGARQDDARSPWRGRRFAFAAASAVSFAAMALGGTMPLGTAADVLPRGAGNSVTPMRAPGTTAPGTSISDSSRRQGGGSPSRSTDRPAATAPPGVLQSQLLAEHPFPQALLTGASPLRWTQATGSAVLIDERTPGTGSAATPDPTRIDAPTLPSAPLSARR